MIAEIMNEIHELGEKILNHWALTDTKQLGLRACAIAMELAGELKSTKADNERLNGQLLQAVSDLESAADCSTCALYDKDPCPHGVGCYKWRGVEGINNV